MSGTGMRRTIGPDLMVGIFVLLLGGLAIWQAAAIPDSPIYAQVGPKAVPYVVGAGLLALGAGLVASALRGGWSWTLEGSAAEPMNQEAPPTNWRALGLLFAGLAANLVLIGPLGFSIAATIQFVLVAAAFGSRRFLRDLVLALVLSLVVWFGFVEVLGVNIGAGVLEGLILRALGQEVY
ncbi:tripartite tricarboxylate transporter TctB family protein [Paracraurococcus lichenis]|uniref:Tripartite tricarboxylate transporter TctB family protein n=1 Tax=Paracraurococcus lichenis TaxID=3064888 RepID=A0ABT9DXT1_9PROT|nr:tripartite tricarboxylate transporter TctB family protein [Paracraurococcus sp. LOR1-02]MDO9708713.1 tripartite tricarboxylate transporter TctB family protein [Paracraurococcus sp. LOR1-02]